MQPTSTIRMHKGMNVGMSSRQQPILASTKTFVPNIKLVLQIRTVTPSCVFGCVKRGQDRGRGVRMKGGIVKGDMKETDNLFDR